MGAPGAELLLPPCPPEGIGGGSDGGSAIAFVKNIPPGMRTRNIRIFIIVFMVLFIEQMTE
jgi:hypothetical protein